jgi:membrane protease YdiL (CAAX protease family)
VITPETVPLVAHAYAFVLFATSGLVIRHKHRRPELGPGLIYKLNLSSVRVVVVKWGLAAPVVLLWLDGRGGSPTWITNGFSWFLIAEAVVLSVVCVVVVPRRKRPAEARAKSARAIAKLALVLPRSPRERRRFAFGAITAGVTEEIKYRAFLIPYLAWVLPDHNWALAVLVSCVVFAAAHTYRGPKALVQVGVFGAFFAWVYLFFGLLPAIVFHALLDLRFLIIPLDLHPPRREPAGSAA